MSFYEKYLKYKKKYIDLKEQNGQLKTEYGLHQTQDTRTEQLVNKDIYKKGGARMIKLFFVRHGSGIHQWAAEKKHDRYEGTEWDNYCYRDAELVEEGKEEAKKLVHFFEENPINLIYTSGLKRTVQTMVHAINLDKIIAENIQIFSTDSLNEIRTKGSFSKDLSIPPNCPSLKSAFIEYVQINKFSSKIFDKFNFAGIQHTDANDNKYEEMCNRCPVDNEQSKIARINDWFNNMIHHLMYNKIISSIGIFSHGNIIKDGIVPFLRDRFPDMEILIRVFETGEVIPLTVYIEAQKQKQLASGKREDRVYTKLYNCDVVICQFDLEKYIEKPLPGA